MRKLLTILFILCSNLLSAQYVASWTVTGPGITGYDIQQSKDAVNWTTIASVSNSVYAYVLPVTSSYYRLKSNGNVAYSKAVYMTIDQAIYSATVSNLSVSTSWYTDKISWTTTSESNVSYYLLEKTTGGAYSLVKQLPAKGNSLYSYSYSRGWFSKKPTYRVTPYFSNGTAGTATSFKRP